MEGRGGGGYRWLLLSAVCHSLPPLPIFTLNTCDTLPSLPPCTDLSRSLALPLSHSLTLSDPAITRQSQSDVKNDRGSV